MGYTPEEKKTSVHVKAKSASAGIHARKDHLTLQIVTDTPLGSPCVFKVNRVSANRFHNHIHITSDKDIDRELGQWLARAYALLSGGAAFMMPAGAMNRAPTPIVSRPTVARVIYCTTPESWARRRMCGLSFA